MHLRQRPLALARGCGLSRILLLCWTDSSFALGTLLAISWELFAGFATDHNRCPLGCIEDEISPAVIDNDRGMLAISKGVGDGTVRIYCVWSSQRDYFG